MSYCPLLSLPGCHTEPIPPVCPPSSQPSRPPAPGIRIRDTQPQLALLKVPVCSRHWDSWHWDYFNEFILNICSAENEKALNEHIPHPHHPLLQFPAAASGLQISPCLSQCPCLPVSGSCPDSTAASALWLHPTVSGASPALGDPLGPSLGTALPAV